MTDLPPLPKSIFRFAGYGYTIHDMHEYGAACAAAEREACALALERTGNDHCSAALRVRREA